MEGRRQKVRKGRESKGNVLKIEERREGEVKMS